MRIDYPRRARSGVARWIPSWKLILGTIISLGLLAVGAFALLVALTPVPEPNDIARAQTSVVYWNDGTTELGRLGDVNRIDVTLSQIPETVRQEVLAAEDREFYNHGGFSPAGLGRAVWNNVQGGAMQGASTITQQYAKNAFLSQERSWQRKAKELVLSVKLETTASKDQILEDYLNTVYFGRGAYGIESAAQAYFGVHAADLTPAQGAMLASLLKSPEGMSPDRAPARLKARWNYVLDGMVSQGWMTPAKRKALTFPEVKERAATGRPSGTNGYLLEAVRQELGDRGVTEAELGIGGLRIVSTFDRAAQEAAVAAVKAEGPTEGTTGLRIGLAAVAPGSGEVVAMYGGADYRRSPLNNATQAIGQAGSTFKPFALAAALRSGITLDSMWNGDSGRDIGGYVVNNYGDESWGDISLLEATEQSVNSVFVDVENTVGVDPVIESALAAGIPADTAGITANLTFVLGTASPHVMDVAHAYATFAARGQETSTTTIRRIEGPGGALVYESAPQARSAFDGAVADQVNYALQKVVTNGTGFAAQELGRPAAGKTGTTNDNMSAWFAGYTPQLSAAVMLVKDNADGQPISLSGTGGLDTVTGGSFPARIWTAFMRGALEGKPVLEFNDPFASPTDTASPTASPTDSPTAPPTASPTDSPTASPTASPTESPTESPTASPTESPTESPTASPTESPTSSPTQSPTASPTATGAPGISPAPSR